MTIEPICPNEELNRLRSILEEGTPEHIGQHTLRAIAFVLERLAEAQAQRRVLPHPSDPRSYAELKRERTETEIALLMARRINRSAA